MFLNQTVSAQPDYSFRFQFHKYNWRVHRKSNYTLYFPKGLDSLANEFDQYILAGVKAVKKSLGTSYFNKPAIIIYPSTDQFYESNIGISEKEVRPFPTFISKGNRLVLAYNKSLDELKAQLRYAIALSIWQTQIGSDEASLTEIPIWFKNGFIQFTAKGWTIQDEEEWRTFLTNRNLNHKISIPLGGKAFCYYLERNFPPLTNMRIFEQLKKTKSLKRALKLVTKRDFDTLYQNFILFYQQRFTEYSPINFQHDQYLIGKLRCPSQKGNLISADTKGDYITYVVEHEYRRHVYIYDIRKKLNKKLKSTNLTPWLEGTPFNYPLIRWDGNDLLVLQPQKGRFIVSKYSSSGKILSKDELPLVDGVSQFYPDKQGDLLLNAFLNGQSDLVVWKRKNNKIKTITSNALEETDLSFNNDSGKGVFISHNPKDTSYAIYEIGKSSDTNLIYADSLASFPFNQLSNVVLLNKNRLLFIKTSNGATQFSLWDGNVLLKSGADCNPISYNPGDNSVTYYTSKNDSVFFFRQNVDSWITDNNFVFGGLAEKRWKTDFKISRTAQRIQDSLLRKIEMDDTSFLAKAMTFRDNSSNPQSTVTVFLSKPYVLELYKAYFSAQLNNDYFINRYQPYLNYIGQFKFPQIGIMAKSGFTDLFENHHFTLAYKMPAGDEGSDFFFTYKNTKRKIDWSFTYFRKVESTVNKNNWTDKSGRPYPQATKVRTHFYELNLSYPLTYYSGLSFSNAFRKDKTIFLATNKYSLDFDPIESNWLISTITYKFNQVRSTIPLLYKGLDLDMHLDLFNSISKQPINVAAVGINACYRQPLYKYITLVTQIHAASSAGTKKILYNLAGMDNTLTPRIDSNHQFAQSAPYAFQALVTPVRGYLQNSRYGNQYALLNADVYFPIFQTLIPLKTQINFIRFFQAGIFSDVGITKETFSGTNLSQKILSYGFSAQSKLAGYRVRFDIGWPYNTQKPLYYISLKL